MRNKLRAAGIALITIATLGLAACGDDGPKESAPTTTETPEAPVTVPDTTPESVPDVPTSDVTNDSLFDGNTDALLRDATEALEGLEESEAEDVAEENGWVLRVVERDGESLPATMDYRDNRVNVAVEDGTVTEVINIG